MTPAGDAPHAPSARTRPAWTTRPGGRRSRSSLVLGVLVLAAVVSTRWIRCNVSPSVPIGFYLLRSVPATLTRGTLVVLPVPPSVRAWQWRPLLKPVAAIAGDEVCVYDNGLWIAGQWYGEVYSAVDGQVLPQLSGCQTLQPGEVFLASTAPRSLDGRYFGWPGCMDRRSVTNACAHSAGNRSTLPSAICATA
jgi:type IV secretory pathway protease TraF